MKRISLTLAIYGMAAVLAGVPAFVSATQPEKKAAAELKLEMPPASFSPEVAIDVSNAAADEFSGAQNATGENGAAPQKRAWKNKPVLAGDNQTTPVAGAETVSVGGAAKKMAKGFFLILGLILVGFSLAKRFRGTKPEAAVGPIEVLARKNLSPRAQLLVVEVEGRRLLLSQTGEQVSFISDLGTPTVQLKPNMQVAREALTVEAAAPRRSIARAANQRDLERESLALLG